MSNNNKHKRVIVHPYADRPPTRLEKEQAKKSGSILGYVSFPPGRPPKDRKKPPPSAKPAPPADEPPGENKKQRGSYINWAFPENAQVLEANVNAWQEEEDGKVNKLKKEPLQKFVLAKVSGDTNI
jgi:hypothetical protein